jgi:hypothetical protein
VFECLLFSVKDASYLYRFLVLWPSLLTVYDLGLVGRTTSARENLPTAMGFVISPLAHTYCLISRGL